MDDFGSKCAQYSVQMQSVSRAHTESLIKFVAPNRRSKKTDSINRHDAHCSLSYANSTTLGCVWRRSEWKRSRKKIFRTKNWWRYAKRMQWHKLNYECRTCADAALLLRCCWCGPTAYDDVSRADATVATIPTECYANYSAPLFFLSSFISVSLYVRAGKKIDSLNIVNYGWMGAWFLCVCVLFRHGRSIFFLLLMGDDEWLHIHNRHVIFS